MFISPLRHMNDVNFGLALALPRIHLERNGARARAREFNPRASATTARCKAAILKL